MTHTRQMADSEGDFGEWQDFPIPCLKDATEGQRCGKLVRVREWESHDGAYTDYQFRCEAGHTWWVDGIDS
jgi:hypothetical protein